MRLPQVIGAALALAVSTTAYRTKRADNKTLPVVDLGYELYQAADFNVYHFSNLIYSFLELNHYRKLGGSTTSRTSDTRQSLSDSESQQNPRRIVVPFAMEVTEEHVLNLGQPGFFWVKPG